MGKSCLGKESDGRERGGKSWFEGKWVLFATEEICCLICHSVGFLFKGWSKNKRIQGGRYICWRLKTNHNRYFTTH